MWKEHVHNVALTAYPLWLSTLGGKSSLPQHAIKAWHHWHLMLALPPSDAWAERAAGGLMPAAIAGAHAGKQASRSAPPCAGMAGAASILKDQTNNPRFSRPPGGQARKDVLSAEVKALREEGHRCMEWSGRP